MPKFKTQLSILGIFLSINFSFAQLDSTKIFNEINSLTNDSLVDDFWRRLDSCDQDLNTFTKPILQTENLVKAICFFKKFGFSDNNRFDKSKISESNAEMHSLYIWMHSSSADLNYYSFPLIVECKKIYKYADDPNYFIQNIQVARTYRYELINRKTIEKVEENSFKDIDLKVVFSFANEYISFLKQFEQHTTKGNWNLIEVNEKTKYVSKYTFKMFQSKNGIYYFESVGNYFKLKQSETNKNIFHYETNVDDTYLELLDNGNLVNKSKEGEVLVTYVK